MAVKGIRKMAKSVCISTVCLVMLFTFMGNANIQVFNCYKAVAINLRKVPRGLLFPGLIKGKTVPQVLFEFTYAKIGK